MGARREPVTAAVRHLRRENVQFRGHLFDYERFPGALGAAEALGIDPHATVKTIVMETEQGEGVVVLMNGDREISTKALARLLGVKTTAPASQRNAKKWTGYQFGGTSPFGMRSPLAVYAQTEIPQMEEIFINGGSRGFLLQMDPLDLVRVIRPGLADLAA